MQIYDNIVELCRENGISISALERNVNFANGTLRRWNEISPSADKLVKVANALDVSVDELLGRAVESTPITQSFIADLTRGLDEDENLIIQKFRSLSDADKVKLLFTIMRFDGQK